MSCLWQIIYLVSVMSISNQSLFSPLFCFEVGNSVNCSTLHFYEKFAFDALMSDIDGFHKHFSDSWHWSSSTPHSLLWSFVVCVFFHSAYLICLPWARIPSTKKFYAYVSSIIRCCELPCRRIWCHQIEDLETNPMKKHILRQKKVENGIVNP